MKIKGKIVRTPEDRETARNEGYMGDFGPGDYYMVHDDYPYRSFCSGKATQLLSGAGGPIDYSTYGNVTDTISWGYHGRGSDLLAVYLLAASLYPNGRLGESHSFYIEKPILGPALRHYKAFSEEVIANLPDVWEMDTEWVKGWIEEREKSFNAETKNINQNQRKNHGRRTGNTKAARTKAHHAGGVGSSQAELPTGNRRTDGAEGIPGQNEGWHTQDLLLPGQVQRQGQEPPGSD